MGVVRYLCITIIFASLVLAANAAVCSGNGWMNNANQCICYSGYRGLDCGTNFGVCAGVAAQPVIDKDDRFPTLDLDSNGNPIDFRSNYLTLSIMGPIVPGRNYTAIEFVNKDYAVTDTKCNLVGNSTEPSFWSMPDASYTSADPAVIANKTCHDRFFLNMYWPYWRQCGFKQSDTNDYFIFTNTFKLTYSDDLGRNIDIEGVTLPELKRTTVVSYKVYVHFAKRITVQTNLLGINVNNTVSLKAAITKFEYNPATSTLLLGISSVVLFPNMFLRDSVRLSIQGNANINATGISTNVHDDTHVDICATYESNCLQYFEFEVVLLHGCDFNAAYIISGIAATCRDLVGDGPGNCTRAVQQYELDVLKSDVCGHVTAQPQITGQLVSWAPDKSAQSARFELGYYGEFTVVMDTQNDFNLSWTEIWAVPDEEVVDSQYDLLNIPKTQWLMKDGLVLKTGFWKSNGSLFDDSEVQATPWDVLNGPCNLTIHDLAPATLSSGNYRVFTQGFRMRFDSRIFYVPLGGLDNLDVVKGYTMHARGRITYASNEGYVKRSEEIVEFAFKSSAAEAEASAHVGLRPRGAKAVASNNQNAPATSISPMAASVAPIAACALVVVAAAVIAAVVIVKRRKSAATSFATLAN